MFETAAAAQVHDERVIVVAKFAKYVVRLFDDLGDIGRRSAACRSSPRPKRQSDAVCPATVKSTSLKSLTSNGES